MSKSARFLTTRRGIIRFPTYLPVTTFGKEYPLDNLLRPYLPRLAQGVMVSYHYARQMESELPLPVFIDSGGFASLFQGAAIRKRGTVGVLEIKAERTVEMIHPRDVLDLQEQHADVAFTLDFPIPPNMPLKEAMMRQTLTIANAHWGLANRRRKDLPLYASVQAWDKASARSCSRALAKSGFDGIAVGGLVPRTRDRKLVLSIIEAVRKEIGDLPLHAFGLGKPELAQLLFEAGVDSVDSSAYVQLAADGRLWSHPKEKLNNPSVTDRMHLALCNLAIATGTSLPLSASKIVFTTHTLSSRLHD